MTTFSYDPPLRLAIQAAVVRPALRYATMS